MEESSYQLFTILPFSAAGMRPLINSRWVSFPCSKDVYCCIPCTALYCCVLVQRLKAQQTWLKTYKLRSDTIRGHNSLITCGPCVSSPCSKYVSEMGRVCKPGGKVILVDFHRTPGPKTKKQEKSLKHMKKMFSSPDFESPQIHEDLMGECGTAVLLVVL